GPGRWWADRVPPGVGARARRTGPGAARDDPAGVRAGGRDDRRDVLGTRETDRGHDGRNRGAAGAAAGSSTVDTGDAAAAGVVGADARPDQVRRCAGA